MTRITQQNRESYLIGADSALTSSTTCPWKPCVVVCHTQKPKARRGKILFINAVNEITRGRAQSVLTDEFLEKLLKHPLHSPP